MKVKEIFNGSFAVYYEMVINRIASPIQIDRWRKALVRAAKVLVPHAKVVLDCCSGAGNVGKFYLKENPEALLINCDISTPLLKLAKKRFGKNASYIRSDNRFFPLKEGSIDVLFSSFCVRNSPDPELTVSEAFRVLKPGAVWAILDFFKLDDRSICSAANNLIFRSFMKVNSIVNREAIEYLFESIERFYTVKEFKELLEDSGFEVTEVKRFMGGVANTVIAVRREV